MIDPLVDDGTVNVRLAVPFPAVAVTSVGVPGTDRPGVPRGAVLSLRAHADKPETKTHFMKRKWRGDRNGMWCIGRAEGVETFCVKHADIIATLRLSLTTQAVLRD